MKDDDDKRKDGSIGYGKPPVHSRFKPGQSGNKKGRPRALPVLVSDEQAIYETLFLKMPFKAGGKRVMKSPFEVVLYQLTKAAMNGDVPAMRTLLGFLMKFNSRKPRLPKLEEMSNRELATVLHLIRAAKERAEKLQPKSNFLSPTPR